ncbi:MAG: phage holin family protein [Thermoanaerobaculia bacterium]|jgi:putative membrane protein|nr:phage holin family protein [Thermoanaerobaculia bacterium]
MKLLVRIALNGLGLWAAAQLLPGIHYEGGLLYLLLAGFVLGAVNLLVKPLVTILSLPFVVLTLGLFFIVINGLMVWLVDLLLAGFRVDSFLWAMAGGLFLAVFNMLLRALFDRE